MRLFRSDDSSIRVWSTVDGSLINTLIGHTWSVCALAISPDGSKLYSAAGDMTIRVWCATALDLSLFLSLLGFSLLFPSFSLSLSLSL